MHMQVCHAEWSHWIPHRENTYTELINERVTYWMQLCTSLLHTCTYQVLYRSAGALRRFVVKTKSVTTFRSIGALVALKSESVIR